MTVPMVVKEFVRHRVAPLQRHSRPMWALHNSQDHMRLQESGIPLETWQTVLEVLAGVPLPDDMPGKSCMLYRCSNKEEFLEHMPCFDEWGLRPDGLVGPRENPVNVVPLFDVGAELTPSVDAGRRALSKAGGSSAEVLMLPGAPEASSSGTHDSSPGAAAAGAT